MGNRDGESLWRVLKKKEGRTLLKKTSSNKGR